MMIQHYNIDIFMLSDTRLDDRSARWKIKQLRKLVSGYSILSFPTSRASYTKHGGYRMNTMGGSMIIISPRCATTIIDSGSDPSGLSVTAYALLSINNQKFCFISYYQPIGNDQSGSSTVYARLQHFLCKNNITDTPLAFASNVASRWMQKFRKRGFVPLIAGDFNADPTIASGSKLMQWSVGNSLHNALHATLSGKYYTHLVAGVPTSSIDHIFIDTSLSSNIIKGMIITSPETMLASDHSIVTLSLQWCGPPTVHDTSSREERNIKRIELSRYNSDAIDDYGAAMQEWHDLRF